MTYKTPPLGKRQQDVLRCLKESGGWWDGCGWTWDTPSGTVTIMESLVKRGLATKKIEKVGWRDKVTYRPVKEE